MKKTLTACAAALLFAVILSLLPSCESNEPTAAEVLRAARFRHELFAGHLDDGSPDDGYAPGIGNLASSAGIGQSLKLSELRAA